MRPTTPAEQLLDDLIVAGAVPVIADGRLRIEAPAGVLTPAWRAEITRHHVELTGLVAKRWRCREDCGAKQPCRRMSRCAEPVYGQPCGVPATCCLCGKVLPHDRRLLCPACSQAFTTDRNTCPEGGRS
jgi:hypothetical protein